MDCRMGCGACCIAPSISALMKPAGDRCPHLDDAMLCTIFNEPHRPSACAEFKAEMGICGTSRREALHLITELESLTCP